ncbi:hypothetical protein [Lysinibacillus sp. NPDC056232]|uniref:hypothetical protein n=1 Tax=Lysinibacillus sp. NPDC056232 TaxID=3345756 RepID=UPI0035E16013
MEWRMHSLQLLNFIGTLSGIIAQLLNFIDKLSRFIAQLLNFIDKLSRFIAQLLNFINKLSRFITQLLIFIDIHHLPYKCVTVISVQLFQDALRLIVHSFRYPKIYY